MFLGKVIGQADSDESKGEANHSRLKVVQKLDLYRNATGPSTIAVDFVGADAGDIVIVGPPSATADTSKLPQASSATNSMIMCILKATGQKPGESQSAL